LFEAPAARKRARSNGNGYSHSHDEAVASVEAPANGNGASPELDDDQRRACETIEGPLLIVAGPGSGKTRTLTHRIARLIAHQGYRPEECLAITFTRRAAAEMKERLATLLPADAAQVPIHTFHSLGLAILREYSAVSGLNRGFRIASEAEKAGILAEIKGLSAARGERMLRSISLIKRAGGPADEETAAIHAAYQRGLMLRNLIDFDDLILVPVKMLEREPEVADAIRHRLRSISIDEFQDIDEQQYRLIRLLAPEGRSLCVIGDPNQAIYGFRGADASCFQRFGADYPKSKTIRLQRNYRSSGTIVAASTQVIAGGSDSIAQAAREMRHRITLHVAPTGRAEAEFVVQSIEELIGGHTFFSIDSGRSNGTGESLSFGDIAVLYRTGAQSVAVVEAFERSGIPFKRHAHAPLSDDPAVAAVLNELFDVASDAPIGARLRAASDRMLEHDQTIDRAATELAVTRLTSLAETSSRDGVRFADAVAVASEADFYDPRAERVSLLTLHASKGLEFRVVFVLGLEDGLLPLHWGSLDEANIGEERRLFYVGMTRAMDRLILTRAEERQWRGKRQAFPPSPFLTDIERELLRAQRTQPLRHREEDRQLKLF
jgi:superfamily I DNA/RNA helicase